jgi:hypothetical protein
METGTVMGTIVVSTGTDADLIQFVRIGFAASGVSPVCSARNPATQTGLP